MTYLQLAKYAAWLALVLSLIGTGMYLEHHWDAGALAQEKEAEAAREAQEAKDNAAAQAAAARALQDQISRANAQDAANAKIIADLQARAVGAESDRDFARRLLAAARQAVPAAGGSAAGQAASQPGADGAAGAQPGGPPTALAGLLAGAAGECANAIQRLSALQAELTPQL